MPNTAVLAPRAQGASIRAATNSAVSKPQASISAAPPGARSDISLPVSQAESARRVVESLARSWNNSAEGSVYKTMLWVPKSAIAGELFEQHVELARNRFTKRMGDVAADYAKTGKYTPAHVKMISEAQVVLKGELQGIVPSNYGMNVSRIDANTASGAVSKQLANDVITAERLSGKTQHNFARNAIKRGSSITYADDVAVVADLKLAKALKSVGTFVQVVEFAPAAAVLLSSKDDREREKALAQIGGKAYGALTERAVTTYGPMLCTAFGLGTMGWGFLACGLATYGAGFYLGDAVEKKMTKVLGGE